MEKTILRKPITEEEENAEIEVNTKMETDTITRLEQKWEEYISFFRKGKKAKAVSDARARAEAEAKARTDAEVWKKIEAEAKARIEAEAKEKSEIEAKARTDAEARKKAEAEVKARIEAEAKKKSEIEAKARAEAEAREKSETEAKARIEADANRKAEVEAKERAVAEVKTEAEVKMNIGPACNVGATEFLNLSLWQQLSGANTDEELCNSWLGLLSGLAGGVNSSVVFLGHSENEPFKPLAFWPTGKTNQSSFINITDRVLKEQYNIIIKDISAEDGSPPDNTFSQIASPVRIDGKLYGVVAQEITKRPEHQLQTASRHLQWGIAWLEKWIISKDLNKNRHINERLVCAVDLLAHILQEDRFHAAATSFVTLLATHLDCDRVSIGFINGNSIKVQALSHNAQFKKQMNLVRSICSAMEESADQQNVLIFPVTSEEGSNVVLRAHNELSKQQKHIAICTIPFIDNKGDSYGALTLERSLDKPFGTEVVELCDSVVALAAPILEEKRRNDSLLINKIWESLRLQVEKLTGSGRVAIKFFAVLSIVMAIFFFLAKGEYRITAKSTIEGKVQHAIVSPYEGYIFEAYVRAGDSVKKGQVMCKLDDRDFRLKRTKFKSQRNQYSKQHRESMVVGKRAEMEVFKEQINQTETQLALLDEQLSRTKLLATFDGLIVSGDLSQSIGSPVERGQVLFEISPLNDYRVKLEVDEREISRINVGQTGNLVLNALPKTQFSVTVKKITPVSTTEEGVNFFHVEAKLDKASERLRPGMEGFGKISVGRNRLIWIWTHGLTDWLHLWAWSWWP